MTETTHKDPFPGTGLRRAATRTQPQVPPAYLEYAWYASITYAMLGTVWGIVIPMVGGVFLAVLAAISVLSVWGAITRIYAPIAWAIGAGVLLILIQVIFHSSKSIENSIVMSGWLFTVVIVQALSLRPGFLFRFALVGFGIGLAVLPYLSIRAEMGSGPTRLGASGTGISNPNTLAMWFGFSVLFFLFYGLQSRVLTMRLIYWVASCSSLFVVALTVSRGALLGLAVACVVGFRSTLKKQFVPVLSFVLLLTIVYTSGAFEDRIDSFMARGAQESGRGKVWPLVLERIMDSPWVGVGLDNIYTLTKHGHGHNPHNAIFFFGLSSGIVPLMCFLGYLAKVGTGTHRIMQRDLGGEAALLSPLVTFALVEIMLADTSFMMQWVVVVFALAAAKHSSLAPRPFL